MTDTISEAACEFPGMACGLLELGRALGARCPMKNSQSVKEDSQGLKEERCAEAKKASRNSPSMDIARRYMELRRLRAQITEAEAARNA
jgi:hypothetical protein